MLGSPISNNPCCAVFYLGIRTKLIAAKASQARKACRACCRCAGSPYGKYVEAETLVEDGQAASCAICQVSFNYPELLDVWLSMLSNSEP